MLDNGLRWKVDIKWLWWSLFLIMDTLKGIILYEGLYWSSERIQLLSTERFPRKLNPAVIQLLVTWGQLEYDDIS